MVKSRTLSSFALTLVICLLTPQAAAGQEPPPSPPSRLVVQVEYFKGAPLAYQSVPGSSWFARFATVSTPVPRGAEDTVKAVDVKTRLDGERVEIKVGVHVGARHFDRLDEVATYHAEAGQTVAANDLEKVGVAPFVFKVLRVSDADVAAPTIVNRTQSIEVSVTEFTPAPLPRALLTLRNLSAKGVRAVELRQMLKGRERAVGAAMEREGKFVMEPGGTYRRRMGITVGQPSGTDFTPEAVESILVVSAVFEDYTYEGDPGPAARKRGMDDGERRQLPHLIALVRAAHAAPDAETPEALSRLRSKVEALEDTPPQASVNAILKSYPELGADGREQVTASMGVAMHSVKRALLDDLGEFEKKFRLAPAENSVRGWLKAKQEQFERWLARL